MKRYSSGMYVRLAFAIAAHLEPEILIVDEVLAVGDYAFQKKCLGKMRDVASGDGRTVLFVSHNMGAISQLCEVGIQLEQGKVAMIGPVRDVIKSYMKSGLDRNAAQANFEVDPTKAGQFLSAEILHSDNSPSSDFSCDEPITIRLTYELRTPMTGLFLYLSLFTIEGVQVVFSDFRDDDPSIAERLGVGVHAFEVRIPGAAAGPDAVLDQPDGVQAVRRRAGEFRDRRARPQCCEFEIRDVNNRRQRRPGVLSLVLPWEHRRIDRVAGVGDGS